MAVAGFIRDWKFLTPSLFIMLNITPAGLWRVSLLVLLASIYLSSQITTASVLLLSHWENLRGTLIAGCRVWSCRRRRRSSFFYYSVWLRACMRERSNPKPPLASPAISVYSYSSPCPTGCHLLFLIAYFYIQFAIFWTNLLIGMLQMIFSRYRRFSLHPSYSKLTLRTFFERVGYFGRKP